MTSTQIEKLAYVCQVTYEEIEQWQRGVDWASWTETELELQCSQKCDEFKANGWNPKMVGRKVTRFQVIDSMVVDHRATEYRTRPPYYEIVVEHWYHVEKPIE